MYIEIEITEAMNDRLRDLQERKVCDTREKVASYVLGAALFSETLTIGLGIDSGLGKMGAPGAITPDQMYEGAPGHVPASGMGASPAGHGIEHNPPELEPGRCYRNLWTLYMQEGLSESAAKLKAIEAMKKSHPGWQPPQGDA